MIIVFPFQQNQATQSLQLVKIFSNSNGGANFFANGVWMLNSGCAQARIFFKLLHLCTNENTWMEMFCLDKFSIYKQTDREQLH